jgi:hypothetical protein
MRETKKKDKREGDIRRGPSREGEGEKKGKEGKS